MASDIFPTAWFGARLAEIAAGTADPTTVWSQQETIPTAIAAYEAFDKRAPGWTKVTLDI